MEYQNDKNDYYQRININTWKDLYTGKMHNALDFEYNLTRYNNKCLVPGLNSYFKDELKEMNRLISLENIMKKKKLRLSFKLLKNHN